MNKEKQIRFSYNEGIHNIQGEEKLTCYLDNVEIFNVYGEAAKLLKKYFIDKELPVAPQKRYLWNKPNVQAHTCPRCESVVDKGMRYCSICGQRIHFDQNENIVEKLKGGTKNVQN